MSEGENKTGAKFSLYTVVLISFLLDILLTIPGPLPCATQATIPIQSGDHTVKFIPIVYDRPVLNAKCHVESVTLHDNKTNNTCLTSNTRKSHLNSFPNIFSFLIINPDVVYEADIHSNFLFQICEKLNFHTMN